ncbi:MAG: hypothetical protein ACSHWW_12575 [Nonlabens sp.]|uniref:hypothetical protein n=1 Tax=Nonlabens sp. TaxID=1888209 RepID=UPI003EF5416C
MKRLILLLVTAVTIISCSMEEDYNTYNVTNNSAEEIYIAFDYDNSVIASFEDPGTVNSNRIIPSMQSFLYSVDEGVLTNDKKLTLIVVTKAVYDANPWQDIVDNDLYDERYDLGLSEIRALDNEIVYN